MLLHLAAKIAPIQLVGYTRLLGRESWHPAFGCATNRPP
jgi:hypothetical protein